MDSSAPPVSLTPAQQKVSAGLRGGERTIWPAEFADELRTELEQELAPFARMLADSGAPTNTSDGHLWVGKRPLDLIHGCEGHYAADLDDHFAWSLPTVRGTIAHKAIELLIGWRDEPIPGELVDAALVRLREAENGLADYLGEIGPAEEAELRTTVTGEVTTFLTGFPPISNKWKPVVEGRSRVELFEGRIVLGTKPDLMLGTADGTTSGRAVIDLKSGGTRAGHRDDLRFYALVDTLRSGVPPFRIATYYLESGVLDSEDVDEPVLRAALRRVVDGVEKMMAVRTGGREPRLSPGPACGWCIARDHCSGAEEWAEERERRGLEPEVSDGADPA